MAPYLGDIAENATIAFGWDTVDGNGASITRATDGTIKVRRLDDGTDCTGTSVTDNEDTPDTGIHECIIDTNDNANYTPSNDYAVWLDGAVIDGQTVNAVLATFSIENRFMRGTDGANTTVPDAAGTAPTANEIRDAIVDDSTRIDASALNTHAAISPATAAALATHDGKLDTAQLDLDTLTGTDGVTLATAQANYAPAKAGNEMDLIDAPNSTAIAAFITALFAKTGITAGGSASFEDMMQAVYAQARGKIVQNGNVYTVYDDDNATLLFTLTLASTSRTVS